jgi:hypothetical protein
MIMKKSLGVILTLLLAVAPATAADFLTGARGGGMGFSYFILSDDPSGALYNPSALGFVRGWQTQLMYEKMTDYDYKVVEEKPYYGQFGFAYYLPNTGTFALNSIQSGSLSKLTNISTFNHLAISYGRQISGKWAVGGTVKYLAEHGFGERTAFDADLGLSFRAPVGVVAAVAAENLAGSKLSPEYRGLNESLPRRYRAGAGYLVAAEKFQAAMLVSEQMEEWGINEKQTASLTNVGTEWWFLQNNKLSFAARTGYTFGTAIMSDEKLDYSGPTAGISLNYRIGFNDLRLDYAWQAYPLETNGDSAPASHYVALTFGWGGVPSFGQRNTEAGTPRIETPRAEIPKAETPAIETPKVETANLETPKAEAPKVEAAMVETPKAETPKAETPKVETSKVETAKAETPKIETPKTKAPKAETPIAFAPPKEPKPAALFMKPEKTEEEAPLKDSDTDFKEAEFKQFNVSMEVNTVASMDFRRVVFYVRPQQVVKTISWKLYIFKAKIKAWSEAEAGRWAVATVEGKGVPPINVIWNGTDASGEFAAAGKYYYILTAEDTKGRKYATEWFNFKLE